MKRQPLLMMLALSFATPAPALESEARLKLSLVGLADRGRDLGLSQASATREGYLDATPWLHLQFSQDWSAYGRVRLFAPSGALLPPGNDNNNIGASNSAFVGLKEAWLDYAGLSSYPGESLRLGRQRIREDDAQYLDQDLDALRWIFDSTLLDAQLGAAHQFGSYRSDGAELPAQQRERSYAFGEFAYDYLPLQRLGARVLYAADNNELRDEGEVFDTTRRDTRLHAAWLGLYADNHAYDWQLAQRGTQRLSYWASGSWLMGQRERAPDDGGLVGAHRDETLRAWTAETGARLHLFGALQIGGAYSFSSGGNPEQLGRQYQQSGAQSNYSRFTGTRSLIYRYNEAYRPELGNLQAATAFVSLQGERDDASVIYNQLRRPHRAGPVLSDGISAAPVQDSHALGQGVDVVLSHYFALRHAASVTPSYVQDEDAGSVLRLRASVFDPGRAYGADAKLEYRVMAEITLWY